MATETIFQHFVFQEFILPFLLVFTIVFAILEKTKLLGEGKKRIDAIVAFVIGLIFVTAIFPKTVVSNLILFLTVSLIIVFVILLLFGFIFGDMKAWFEKAAWMKWVLAIGAGIAVIIAVIWAVGVPTGIFGKLFTSDWSGTFWTNFLFVAAIAIALALVLIKKKT